MHIWLHPDTGYWYAKQPTGKRQSLKTKDKKLALSRLEDLKRGPRGPLILSAIEHYFAEKQHKASYPQMLIAWKHLQPWFGHLRHDQVTRQVCRLYATSREKDGVRPGTIGRELSVVKSAVRYSFPNTPSQWDIPSPGPSRETRLTKAEYRKLVGACDVYHVRLFVILALNTGARRSAILELTWDRVDFERRLINLRVDGLQGKGRAIVPMTEMAFTALKEASDLAQSGHVIEYAGQPIKAVKRGFKRAVERAGLDKVTPHVLRHTAATWMAEAGVPMTEIAAYLGHRDSRVTERIYAKFTPTYLHKAAAALSI